MAEEKPTKKKRQSRSAGQVIERGPDKYALRIFLGRDSEGKRHYHNETFLGKKKEAQTHLRKLLTMHKAGESLTITKDTLGAFLDEWLGSKPDLKKSTAQHYKDMINLYARPYIGGLMLAKVDAGHIQKLYEVLAEKGLSRGSLVYVHVLLKSAFKLAVRRRKITYNPMDGVDSPGGKRLEEETKEKREQRTMTPEQVALFWAAADQTRFKTLFTLAYNIGCRPGELLGLKWEYIDTASMTIKIRKTIHWRKGKKKGAPEWYLDTPKTEKGRRDVPLTESLVELLASHRKAQLEERMKAGRAWRDNGFVFADEIGEPYSQNRLLYFCKKILKLAGLPEHFTSYSARHTSATLAIAGGIDPKTVADRLGHTDVRITLKTYTHPTAGMQTEASRVIEQALSGRK